MSKKSSKINLSVVILAKNEQERIKRCLDSVINWVNEIIVIDDDSGDSTSDIASSLGAKVIRKKMEIEGAHRNWAYAQAQNEWILSLDSDEVMTQEIKTEVENALSSKHEFTAFTIPRKNFIGDYWLQWGGFYPSSQLKLFKKDTFRWEEVEVHPKAYLEGRCGHLANPMMHYTYRDFADFVNKLNKQTTLEAIKWAKLSEENPKKARYKMNFGHAVWRTVDRFIRTFVAKKGYRDGFTGFMMAYFASIYQFLSYAKYWEIKKRSSQK